MNKVECLNPWDCETKRIYLISGIYPTLPTFNSRWGMGDAICIKQNEQCTLSESVESSEQTSVHDRRSVMHNNNYLCYCMEGNVVDRSSSKNGKGWCENVSPTLNTQDRHAICFQLCGNRNDPSVSFSDKAYCIPANPMSDRGQAVCYEK